MIMHFFIETLGLALKFFSFSNLNNVYRRSLICPLSFPKVSAEKIHYRRKMLEETEFLYYCVTWK